MKKNLNRRDFNNLSVAALGGVVTGSLLGLGNRPAFADENPSSKEDKKKDKVTKHGCRGLNSCKNQDRDGKNACAGQGDCATVMHECKGKNACKYLGGCGSTAGKNECKGKGECAVPMKSKAWKAARTAFEKRMKAAGKKFGPAPAAPKKKS